MVAVLTGSSDVYAWNGRKPYHSVNFVTVHDGFTMYDLFSYDEKQNGCGLLNTICCDDPYSACGATTRLGEDNNRSRNWGRRALQAPADAEHVRRSCWSATARRCSTAATSGCAPSTGTTTPTRTWADNEWNWFRWGEWQSTYSWHRHRMHDFVRNLIQLRKDHSYALAPAEHGGGMPFAWKNTSQRGHGRRGLGAAAR